MADDATTANPRVLDTYSLVYAFTLLFLFPGAVYVGTLPFRTYTFAYVSAIAVPFVLGLVATVLTDSRDDARTKAIRLLVLIPVIAITGVTVLFTSSLLLVPINQFMTPQMHESTSPVWTVLIVVLAAPLLYSLFSRVRRPSAIGALQALPMLFALAVVAGVIYFSFGTQTITELARKDVIIYIVGALTWYLPAFAISAGAWRSVGLV